MAPILLAQVDTPGEAIAVATDGEHVAVADYLDAIRFYYAMIRRAADGPLAAD